MSKEYDSYLKDHIAAVNNGYFWIEEHIGMDKIRKILPEFGYGKWSGHDNSKRTDEEYDAYDRYFYGPHGIKDEKAGLDDWRNEKYQKTKRDFDYAWLHHIHNNPHHWQYWVLMDDDPETGERYRALEMPDRYILEMICDWWSFSWCVGDLYEIFNWWNEHTDKIVLAEKTRMQVIGVLNLILEKLNEMAVDEETVNNMWREGENE